METLKELFQFLWKKKKFWLVPIILIILIIGILIILSSGSAVAPVICPIFYNGKEKNC